MRYNKYGAKKVVRNGIKYDSILEADYHEVLIMIERAGKISNLEYHKERIYLTRAKIGYEPDFTYYEDGIKVYIDTKGRQTPEFKLKMRLWAVYGPGPLRLVKRIRGGFETFKVIEPVGELF